MRQVHADLVRAAGLQRHVEQGEGSEFALDFHQCDGSTAVFIRFRHHTHMALTRSVQPFVQMAVDDLQRWRPRTRHQRLVTFRGVARTKLILQVGQRAALFSQQENARGFFVEAMYELQKRSLGPRAAQLLDDAKAHAAATVHRYAGGFMDGQQMLVFIQQREFARRHDGGGRLGQAHRWHANLVARGHPRIGTRPAFVDTHLARADDAVDMRLGHALEPAHEVVIQPLAAGFHIHDQALYRARGGRTHQGGHFGRYTAPLHVRALSA